MMLKLSNAKSTLWITVVVVVVSSALPLQAAIKKNVPNQEVLKDNGQLLALSWGDVWNKLRHKKVAHSDGKDKISCIIAPGKLRDSDEKGTIQVWSIRPLFIWHGEMGEITVRHLRSNKLMWHKTLETKASNTIYQGEPLQPGQVYFWHKALTPEQIPRKISFRIMKAEERDRISAELKELETKLKAKGASAEKIVLARVKYFADKQLWSDALREIYSVTNPSPELANIKQQIRTHYFCPIQQANRKAQTEPTLDYETSLRNQDNAYSGLEYYGQKTKNTIGYRLGEASSLRNLGNAYYSIGQYPKALEYYQHSLAITKQIGIKVEEGATLSNIGLVYYSLGQYPKALAYYQHSLAITKQIGIKAEEGATLSNIGLVYYSLGEYAKALDYYQVALAIARKIGDKAGEGNTLNNIGSLFNTMNKYGDAEKYLFNAIKIWEYLRSNELTYEQQISIFEQQADSYSLLQNTLVAQNKTNKALEIAERSRTRAFMNVTGNNKNLLNIQSPSITEIKQIAQQQQAYIVEYSIIDIQFTMGGKKQRLQKLYIWVIKPTGEIKFKQVDLKSINTSLKNIVTSSRESIGVRGEGVIFTTTTKPINPQQKLRQLHKILIKPIAKLLPHNPNEQIIFIPQKSLFLVPFSALQDESGRYLIEKHTILTTPSIQVLELTNERRKRIKTFPGKSRRNILIVGNPTMPKFSQLGVEQQLLPLPGAEWEAEAIAPLFNTKALTGDEATETAIKAKLPQAGVIHLATHGLLFDGFQGLQSSIALAPSSQDNGLLTAEEILDIKLNAELVVLSACNSGRGRITSDGVIGLSRSFLMAGTPSVVASLWSLPDKPTGELMVEFHKNLLNNLDKAKALRQAMLKMKKKYPQPSRWAAFTLIGQP